MRNAYGFFVGVSFVLILLAASGCSPTGWATRSVEDGSSLSPGDRVTILQSDGTTISGEFAGVQEIPFDEYTDLYTLGIQQEFDGKRLPAIGQSVYLTTQVADTKIWKGQFLGFDESHLWIRPEGQSDTEKVYFTALNSLSGEGAQSFQTMELRGMYLNGRIPLMTAVVVNGDGRSTKVPLSSIRELTVGDNRRMGETQNSARVLDPLLLQTFIR